MRDIVDGAALWPLWGKLGWNDILQRYRRSLLGPLWLTASMAIMVIALGVVYGKIFKVPLNDFIPFLCLGLLVWGFISTTLMEAGGLFTGSESYIKQIRLPYSVYVYRFIWSKIIIFAHNFVIYFGILLYFWIWPGAAYSLCTSWLSLTDPQRRPDHALSRHDLGALSRYSANRGERSADRFFHDTHTLETGSARKAFRADSVQPILPFGGSRPCAVARPAAISRELSRRDYSHGGECVACGGLLHTLPVADLLLGLT